jgi:hypothetical protein
LQDGEKYSTGRDSDQAIPIAPSAQTPGRYHSLCCTEFCVVVMPLK